MKQPAYHGTGQQPAYHGTGQQFDSDRATDMEVDICPSCFQCESQEYSWVSRVELKGAKNMLVFCSEGCANRYKNRRMMFRQQARKIESGQLKCKPRQNFQAPSEAQNNNFLNNMW